MYPSIRFVPVDFHGVNGHLRRFLAQMDHVTYASDFCATTFMGGDSLVLWRNRIANWFLEKCTEDYLCCFDDDAVPCEGTMEMLNDPADIVGCQFFSKGGTLGHRADGTFSMAAYKVSRNALNKMAKPYYRFVYSEDFTHMTLCECLWFCQQAREAGFHPVKRGAIAHKMSVGVIPSSDPDEACKMKFMHQIDEIAIEVTHGRQSM